MYKLYTKKTRTVTIIVLAIIAIFITLFALQWHKTDQGMPPQATTPEQFFPPHGNSAESAGIDSLSGSNASTPTSRSLGGSAGRSRRYSVPTVGNAPPAKGILAPQETEQDLRNAIASKDQQSLTDIFKLLREDRDGHADVIRRLAIDAEIPMFVRLAMVGLMREMRDAESLDVLLVLSREKGEPALRAEALKALGMRPETEAEDRLRQIAADTSNPGRAMALSLMGGGRGGESRGALLAVVRQGADAKHEDVNAALYSLRHYRDEETVATLLGVARNEDLAPRLRATALYSLGVTGTPKALSAIKSNLASPEREIRYSAVLASARISDAEVSASLIGQLCDTGNWPHVRKAASASLSQNANATDLEALRQSVSQTDGFGIILAGDVFVAKDDKEAVPLLRAIAKTTSDRDVVNKLNAAITALAKGEK